MQIENVRSCVSEINIKCEIMAENVHQMNEIIFWILKHRPWNYFIFHCFIFWQYFCDVLILILPEHFFNDFKFIPIAVCQSEYHWNELPKRLNCETILKSESSGPFFFPFKSINQFHQRVVFNGLPDAWIWIWLVVIRFFF